MQSRDIWDGLDVPAPIRPEEFVCRVYKGSMAHGCGLASRASVGSAGGTQPWLPAQTRVQSLNRTRRESAFDDKKHIWEGRKGEHMPTQGPRSGWRCIPLAVLRSRVAPLGERSEAKIVLASRRHLDQYALPCIDMASIRKVGQPKF